MPFCLLPFSCSIIRPDTRPSILHQYCSRWPPGHFFNKRSFNMPSSNINHSKSKRNLDPTNPHFRLLEATLSYPGEVSRKPWTSPTIPCLAGHEFEPNGPRWQAQRREAYWRDVIEQRKNHLPPSLDLSGILRDLALSCPNLTRYPSNHTFYREEYAPTTLGLVARLELLVQTVTDPKNAGLGALVDLDDLDFPSVEMLWTLFIIGDKGQKGPIHYCIPNSLYKRLLYLRVHFLVPEWNFPGHDTHRFFWYGHPQYVGPEPPRESLHPSSAPTNHPVVACPQQQSHPQQQQSQAFSSAATWPLVQSSNPFIDHWIQTAMPQPQTSASTLGWDRHPVPSHTYNTLGLSINPTTGQQHIPPGQQMYGLPPVPQPPSSSGSICPRSDGSGSGAAPRLPAQPRR